MLILMILVVYILTWRRIQTTLAWSSSPELLFIDLVRPIKIIMHTKHSLFWKESTALDPIGLLFIGIFMLVAMVWAFDVTLQRRPTFLLSRPLVKLVQQINDNQSVGFHWAWFGILANDYVRDLLGLFNRMIDRFVEIFCHNRAQYCIVCISLAVQQGTDWNSISSPISTIESGCQFGPNEQVGRLN